MPDIRLARIDNRLIHGQVAIAWTSFVQANLIIVVDNQVASDTLQQNLLSMSTPDSVQVRFFTVEKTIDVIHKAAPSQHILLLTRTPIAMADIVDGGVPITEIVVANMHEAPGKNLLISKHAIYVNKQELEAFKRLAARGIKITAQMIPSAEKADLCPFIEKMEL